MKENEQFSNLTLNLNIAFSLYISWFQVKALDFNNFEKVLSKPFQKIHNNTDIKLLTYKINRISKFLKIDSCLPKSLTTYKLLSKYGLSPMLVIGVKKDATNLKSHAWIELDNYVFNDDANACANFKEMKRYK